MVAVLVVALVVEVMVAVLEMTVGELVQVMEKMMMIRQNPPAEAMHTGRLLNFLF
jgi:hypothetical protein